MATRDGQYIFFYCKRDYQTADEYYRSMKQYATDSCRYKGGAMSANDMLVVGRKYGRLTGMSKFGENMRSEDYFNNKANRDNARIVCFQKDGGDHYAKINSISMKKGIISYTDSDDTSSVNINEV